MTDRDVKKFVRETLGCDCAEEVFDHIENEKGVDVEGIRLRNRINVGNRLLVYVAIPGDDVKNKMDTLIKAGKKERDGRGFNRFRLVLVADVAAVKQKALLAFDRLSGLDEKIHLHVVGKAGVRDV